MGGRRDVSILDTQKNMEKINYEHDLEIIIFNFDRLLEKLEKNKLKKCDREMLIIALHILKQNYEPDK